MIRLSRVSLHHQRGMSVVDVAFWGVIFSAGMGLRVSTDSLIADREWAKRVGNELSALNVAVAQRLSNQPTLPDGIYNDYSNFHSVTCGGVSPIEALPCQQRFNNTYLSSLLRDIVVSTTMNDEGIAVRVATISLNPARKSPADGPDRALAGTIVSAAGVELPRAKNLIDYAFRWNASVNPATAEVSSTVHLASANSIWVNAVGDTVMHGNLEFELGPGGVPAYDMSGVQTISAARFVDWEGGGFQVSDAQSRLASLEADTLSAPRVVDSDDSNFFLDPSGDTELNALELRAIRVNKIATVGAACNRENSVFARTSSSNLVVCENGQWVRPGEEIPQGAIFAFDTDRCPENQGFVDLTRALPQAQGRTIVGVNQAYTAEGPIDFAPYHRRELAGRTHVQFNYNNFPQARLRLEGSELAVHTNREEIDRAGENNDDLNIYYRLGATTGHGSAADIRAPWHDILMCIKI